MFIPDFFEISLDTVPLDGQNQGDIGTPGFDFRLHLLRPDKLAPHIYPAAYTVDIGCSPKE